MEYKNLDDQKLIELFVSGDKLAIKTLFYRYRSKLYTYIMIKSKDRELAQDIMQDAFIKVIKCLENGKYLEKGTFINWLIRIAHNLLVDHYRKQKHLKVTSSDDENTNILNNAKLTDGNIEDQMILNRTNFELRHLVGLLPEDQKEVLLMRIYGDFSFKEIADQTGVSINTALGRMRYALINLKKQIAEKNLNLTY